MQRPIAAHTFGLTWTHSALCAIENLQEHGFIDFELLAMPPHLDSQNLQEQDAAPIRKVVNKLGGRILALDLPSNDINLASTQVETVQFTKHLYKNLLESAARLEAESIIVLPGKRHGLLPPPDDRLINILIDEIGDLSKRAAQLGITILLENHPLTLVRTANELDSFLITLGQPNIQIAYDLTNAAAMGADHVSELSLLGDRISMVHLSDSPQGEWKHDRVGSGDIDFLTPLTFLKSNGFQGDIVTEIISPSPVQDLVTSRDDLTTMGWVMD